MTHGRWVVLATAALLVAGANARAQDGGALDASATDAAGTDGSPVVETDAGGPGDAAAPADAAGSPDANAPLDAGPADAAGLADAAVPPDAAMQQDASMGGLDAASGVDVRVPPPDAGPAFGVRIGAQGSEGACPAPCRALETDVQFGVVLAATVTGPGAHDATVLWELLTRPVGATADIQSATSAQALLEPDLQGIWELRVTARAANGAQTYAQLQLRVGAISFATAVVVTVDSEVRRCEPECDRGSILIGEQVIVDASGSSNDPFHGELRFSWSLMAPAGATATLTEESTGRVSLRPDVDGTWEIKVRVEDEVDGEDRTVSFVIPSAAYWQPPLVNCAAGPVHDGTPRTALALAALALALARWRRRR